jgi:hypothetical protein
MHTSIFPIQHPNAHKHTHARTQTQTYIQFYSTVFVVRITNLNKHLLKLVIESMFLNHAIFTAFTHFVTLYWVLSQLNAMDTLPLGSETIVSME